MSFPSCGCSTPTSTVIRSDNFNRADDFSISSIS